MADLAQCKETCIANVGGQCAVKQCKGPITSTGRHGSRSVEDAAGLYEASQKMFAYYFSDEYKDEDKDE